MFELNLDNYNEYFEELHILHLIPNLMELT